MHKKIMVSVVFSALLLGLAAFGGCPQNSPNPGTDKISIQNFSFNPATDTVAKGTTITWTNKDAATHTVTSGEPGTSDGIFDSGDLVQNQTFSHTFDSTGTFKYHCKHHSSMIGQIIVQ